MMDPSTIRALANKAAREARREGRLPYGFYDSDDVDTSMRDLPFLGSYVPKGYKLVTELFVDASGFGREDEPAFTFREFCQRIRCDIEQYGNPYFYAIREAGQFQVYVGVYRKVTPRSRKASPAVKVPELGSSPSETLARLRDKVVNRSGGTSLTEVEDALLARLQAKGWTPELG
jgi:hypothetical protein